MLTLHMYILYVSGSVTGSSVRIFFGPSKNLFCLQYNFTVENVIIFKNIFSEYVSDRTLDPSTEPTVVVE